MDLPASIAITGASGFIGSHLVDRLAAEDRCPITLSRRNGFDICDPSTLSTIPKFDACVHLAAETFVPDADAEAELFFQTNIGGTLNVLEMCRRHQAALVFLSSYVYGNPQRLPVDESHPVSHWNPYASTKLVGEEMCRAFASNFGVPVVILRLFNVYGAGQRENFLIPKIIAGAQRGQIRLENSRPRRDFVHVRDVVDAIVRSLCVSSGHQVFNVGSGKSFSVREVADMVASMFPGVSVEFSEVSRPHEVLDVVADCSLIHDKLGWSPRIDLPTGLAELVEAQA